MYIGVDVGGTKIGIASFSNLDHPIILDKISFPTEQNYEEAIRQITSAIKKLCPGKVEAIGLGAAGAINQENAEIYACSAYPDWKNKPLKKDLERNFKCLVAIENDATAAALGEAVYGHGRNKSFIFIIWGTGIGGAEVINKNEKIEIFPFEPGHQVIIKDGELDDCGQRGCLEAYCGGKAFTKRYKAKPKDLTEDQWQEILENMAQGMLNVLVIRQSRLIIFGGGIACKQERRLKQLHQLLNIKFFDPPGKIILSKFGEEAGLYGALALLRKETSE